MDLVPLIIFPFSPPQPLNLSRIIPIFQFFLPQSSDHHHKYETMPNRRFLKKEDLDRKILLHTSDRAIVNLSNHTLTIHEKTLLSRGLSFCPQLTHLDYIDIHRDTLLFNRSLRLKQFFKEESCKPRDPFQNPTGWTPPVGISPTLDTYINVTTTEILENQPAPIKCNNLSNFELDALENFRKNKNLIIKQADKGGAIVLMKKMTDNRLTCLNCKKTFTTIGNLRLHETTVHPTVLTRYQCWYCDKHYSAYLPRVQTASSGPGKC